MVSIIAHRNEPVKVSKNIKYKTGEHYSMYLIEQKSRKKEREIMVNIQQVIAGCSGQVFSVFKVFSVFSVFSG